MDMTTVLVLGRDYASARHEKQKAFRTKKRAQENFDAAVQSEAAADRALSAAIEAQLNEQEKGEHGKG